MGLALLTQTVISFTGCLVELESRLIILNNTTDLYFTPEVCHWTRFFFSYFGRTCIPHFGTSKRDKSKLDAVITNSLLYHVRIAGEYSKLIIAYESWCRLWPSGGSGSRELPVKSRYYLGWILICEGDANKRRKCCVLSVNLEKSPKGTTWINV